jgi:hypothetical protein
MYNNREWGNPKVVMYCQIGGSLDMANFSIKRAVEQSGLPPEDFELVFLCWKTPQDTYEWLDNNNFKYVDMDYDEGKGFLWNLYKGWNLGYEVGFQHADFVCPIATDHSFYKNWLANLLKHGKSNRIVTCKLIEPGTLPTLHTARNFGLTADGQFNESEFLDFAEDLFESGKDTLVTNSNEYGHRFDAMPWLMPRDVWEKFGPMNKELAPTSPDIRGVHVTNITGDTDFFNRCESGKVEITKALDAISYHCGGIETKRNEQKGIYT